MSEADRSTEVKSFVGKSSLGRVDVNMYLQPFHRRSSVLGMVLRGLQTAWTRHNLAGPNAPDFDNASKWPCSIGPLRRMGVYD